MIKPRPKKRLPVVPSNDRQIRILWALGVPMVTVSASQVDTWIDCPAKWAWDKLGKIPRPDTDSTRIGTRSHTIAEDYMNGLAVPDPGEVYVATMKNGDKKTVHPGRLIQAGLHLLPPPGSMTTEREFFISYGGVIWRGFIDLYNLRALIADIRDHKTTKDFRWMKTPEILARDAQAIIYSLFGWSQGATNAELTWIYYCWGKTPYRARESKLTVEDLPKTLPGMMAPFLKAAREIYAAHRAWRAGELKSPGDLPKNTKTCSAYGGCPYVERCNLTPGERLRGHFRKRK